MELRPYQQRAVDEAFTVPGRPIFCAPTGSGKTVVQAYIAERAMREGQSIAILTPRAEIFDQTHSTLMDVVGWQNVSTLRAGHRWDAMRRVHVVSWPTLIARLRKSEAWLPAVDMVLADECHLATAPQILNVLERYSDRKVIGFTATPARATGSGLGVYFDSIRQVTTVRELIQEGYLTPCEYWGGTLTDVTDVKIRQGDYDTKELSKRAVMIVGDVVENWLRLASDRHTIVFAVDIAHAEALHDRFLQSGVQSVCIHNKLTPDKRDEAVARFKSGEARVLVNVTIASYGFDVPSCDCIVVARPTKSIVLWLQMCLDTETEILTSEGWKGVDEVGDDDMCAGFNMEDDSIEWCEIDEKVVRPLAPGERMLTYQGNNASIRVTDQHDLVIKARGAKKWLKEPAEKTLLRKDLSCMPVAGTMIIPDAPISDAELRFLGWVLTDGTINHRGRQVTITQSVKHVEYCKDIENTLDQCGFRWRRSVTARSGNEFGGDRCYEDGASYRVSFGNPRKKTDRHLRGCESLLPWLDKSIPKIYDSLSARQFLLLLDAMFLGDGSKFGTVDYQIKTREISFGNENMADRIQALAVVRGLRCNKSTHTTQNIIHKLRFRDRTYITIPGVNVADGSVAGKKPYKRTRWLEDQYVAGETVWCVRNRLGTLVTRRRGKVAIVGNCGRGMRIHPEKAVCRVLDHAGNTRALGEAEDSFRWELKGRKAVTNVTRERKEAVARQDFTCADCGYMFSGSRTCPNCGWEAPLTKKDVAVIDADLVRIGKEQVKALPKEWPAPEMVYRMLKGHAVFSNYKEGWVAHKFKERCQVWPPNEWKGLAGIPPSPIVKNWIISQNIRYAKRKAG